MYVLTSFFIQHLSCILFAELARSIIRSFTREAINRHQLIEFVNCPAMNIQQFSEAPKDSGSNSNTEYDN